MERVFFLEGYVLFEEAVFVIFEYFSAFDNLGRTVACVEKTVEVLVVVLFAVEKLFSGVFLLHQLL